MLVLVTGASGFLGKPLLRFLDQSGYRVLAVSRNRKPEWSNSLGRVSWVTHDLTGRDPLTLDSDEPIALVHFAGATLGAGLDEAGFLMQNERALVNILSQLPASITRVILASSQSVYGDVQRLNVTEDMTLDPNQNAYGCSKVNMENWARLFQKKYEIPFLALRYTSFIGGGGLIDYIIERALAHAPIELFGSGNITRDYLSVESGVRVVDAALTTDLECKFMPVNVGPGSPNSAKFLAEFICHQLNSRSEVSLSDIPGPQGDLSLCIDRAKRLLKFDPEDVLDCLARYCVSVHESSITRARM